LNLKYSQVDVYLSSIFSGYNWQIVQITFNILSSVYVDWHTHYEWLNNAIVNLYSSLGYYKETHLKLGFKVQDLDNWKKYE
jgi:hypothetical protein